MGVFTSLQAGASALTAAQTAIQIAGHNIANAGNPDYTRQRTEMVPRVPVQSGGVLVGNGVDVARIERIFNRQVDELLRSARSDLGMLSSKEQALSRLEGIFNELDGIGLSTAMSRFFDAAENLAGQPQDITARRLFIAAGETLAETFRVQDRQILDLRRDLNSQVVDAVQSINQLTHGIAELNREILAAEKGGLKIGAANDLRVRRDALLNRLAEIVDIKATETSQGTVNVSVGSDFLVEDGTASDVELDSRTDGEIQIVDPRIGKSNKLLGATSGRLHGILQARDTILPAVAGELSQLARGVIFEVNRKHVGGAGLVGHTEVLASAVPDALDLPLDRAGLEFTPRNGSFDLKVRDEDTGQIKTFNIEIDLDGLGGDDTTLQSLASDINTALQGDFPTFAATISPEGRLRIDSGDDALTFRFADDTSNVLASLGIGTFFSGTGARDMGVVEAIVADPRRLATGLGDGPADPRNIQSISDLRNAKVLQNDSSSFEDFYQGMVGVLGVQAAEAQELLRNQETINEHLANERAAISGVNVDEETIDLLRFQRIFQGSARYISVVDSVLESLVNLI